MRRVTLAARRAQAFLRKPPKPRWMRPAARYGGAGLALALVAGALLWGTASGTLERLAEAAENRIFAATGALGLIVGEIQIAGRHRADPSAVAKILDIAPDTPLLAIDSDALHAELERLPWIEEAEIRRILPDIVQVRLVERQPLALWQKGGTFRLIDRTGRPIEIPLDDAAVAHWRHLRVVVGERAPERAAELFAVLSTDPDLFAHIEAANWIGERRWTLRTDNEADVYLPEEDVERAWRTLGRLQREQQILERAVSTIDLRFLPDRIRVRLLPEALPERDA